MEVAARKRRAMRRLRRWVLGIHGTLIEVHPRRWWWPPDRKIARLAARLINIDAERIYGEMHETLRNRLLFGENFVHTAWRAPSDDR